MGLQVIGAGFGRTGTESMKRALEMLDLGRCHHMYEVLPDPEQYALWQAIADGQAPDWHRIYDGFGAAVDWPTARYWRELADVYPDAKVLLTVRSPESWWRSFSETIMQFFLERRTGGDLDMFGYKMIARETFGGKIEDADHCMAVFEANIREVKETIPPERLIVYELGSGWEPLCAGLGVPVPDAPYPSGNAKAEFHERGHAANAEREARMADN